jgi:hypothetical protein
MSEKRRDEKKDEKEEKDEEKRGEKEEKWRRDRGNALVWAAVLVWGALVILAETTGYSDEFSWNHYIARDVHPSADTKVPTTADRGSDTRFCLSGYRFGRFNRNGLGMGNHTDCRRCPDTGKCFHPPALISIFVSILLSEILCCG